MFPTVTFPKLRLLGLDPSVPAATPVPDKDTERVGFEALEAILTVPLALAAVVGVKVTLNEALCPAPSVSGVVIPLNVNPAPLIPA